MAFEDGAETGAGGDEEPGGAAGGKRQGASRIRRCPFAEGFGLGGGQLVVTALVGRGDEDQTTVRGDPPVSSGAAGDRMEDAAVSSPERLDI
ncbi:hypothetical protein [Streptomyces sp. BP-8]|uniref:Uncharacterized protein n=1 Tax=Streptomyces sirii TaxID=3127701 RepID=A0ABZ2QMJ8_9ACTN